MIKFHKELRFKREKQLDFFCGNNYNGECANAHERTD
jgi:hypothetical protein